jgi:hypothetical protein
MPESVPETWLLRRNIARFRSLLKTGTDAAKRQAIADQMKGEDARTTLLQFSRRYERLAKVWEKADGNGQDEQDAG